MLSQGKLSLPTQNFLRRLGADEHYRKDPEEVLSVLHDTFVRFATRESLEAQDALVSLAEISFHHASKTDDPKYFLSAVAYAWAYLFPPREDLRAHAIDPRLRLAIDLYNRGLSRAFTDKNSTGIVFRAGLHETGFGKLNIQLDDSELQWGNRRLTVFTSVAELEVRGLRNRYRWRGLGAPLAAATESVDPDDTNDFLVKNLRVPVSAVMTFDDFDGQLASGVLETRLHLRVAYTSDSIEINGESIGLEMEPTASLAFMLTESDPWARELKGLFQGDLEVPGSGLASLEPYHPGRIPVVLVHGTASSAARWADILNDLTNDRTIRERYQFWLFTYNTGSPIAYSAWKLRKGIHDLVKQVDPESKDPALQRIVVVGHSQGGLLTKLTAVDSGNVLWDHVSDRSFEEMDLEPESREILGGSLFVKPVPEVERVVFVSTPHRGSYLAEFGIAKWMSRFVRAPANLVRVGADFVSQDAEASGIREVERVDGAIGNMSPSSPFLAMLLDMPVASGVHSHSIISVNGGKAEPEESDGVVKYKSAHIGGVDSELVVDSGHSCQSEPLVIAELRRILLVHLGRNPAPAIRLFPK
ncbi:MAG: alpha/beta fold hydrolase [Deltaproteobacteria bacterium]|nr:alpha/beta fold hydrolase [Deltaproteobacteria bacterium]